jgi:hypothetical protein
VRTMGGIVGREIRTCAAKTFETMVARDGIERFGVPCFQQVADSTKDRKDTEDRKDSFCVRFVCVFSVKSTRKLIDAADMQSNAPSRLSAESPESWTAKRVNVASP